MSDGHLGDTAEPTEVALDLALTYGVGFRKDYYEGGSDL